MTTVRRVLAGVVAAGLVAGGCGDGGADGRPLVALDQPSALQLLDDLGDHGTFELTVELGAGEATTELDVTGRYVRAADGNVVTEVDLDVELVRGEIDRLLATGRLDRGEIDPLVADAFLSASTPVTDQLQLGLADLLLAAGTPGEAGALATQPIWAFSVVDGSDEADLHACEDALVALRDAVRRRVLDDGDDLGPSYEADPERLGGRELDDVEDACTALDNDVAPPGPLVEGDELRVSSTFSPVVRIAVRLGDGEPFEPSGPTAPLLDRFGIFFLAIDHCGELPWLYSNFAAANSFTSPEEQSYIGPTPFGEVPVCEEDVPS